MYTNCNASRFIYKGNKRKGNINIYYHRYMSKTSFDLYHHKP